MMSPLRAVWTIGIWVLAAVVTLALLVVMTQPRYPHDATEIVAEQIPAPVPDPIPNLSVEELAAMSGFDASTEQTRREQVRNNDLQWRVEKLEREVRNLNQRVYGITELRIGDEQPPKPEGTE